MRWLSAVLNIRELAVADDLSEHLHGIEAALDTCLNERVHL